MKVLPALWPLLRAASPSGLTAPAQGNSGEHQRRGGSMLTNVAHQGFPGGGAVKRWPSQPSPASEAMMT
jgi:hypothetical protein